MRRIFGFSAWRGLSSMAEHGRSRSWQTQESLRSAPHVLGTLAAAGLRPGRGCRASERNGMDRGGGELQRSMGWHSLVQERRRPEAEDGELTCHLCLYVSVWRKANSRRQHASSTYLPLLLHQTVVFQPVQWLSAGPLNTAGISQQFTAAAAAEAATAAA